MRMIHFAGGKVPFGTASRESVLLSSCNAGEAPRSFDNKMTTRLSRFNRVSIAVAAAMLLASCAASLNWRYEHDSPLMVYTGWLIEQGMVPYRDFFDMNLPGTYFVMWAMGTVFGWNDLGFRIFDLLCLASIGFSTYLWMRRIGKLSAFTAAAAFSIWYLSHGPVMSLQREYLALVPFVWMLAIATGGIRFRHILPYLSVGFLTASTILIKPQFLLLCLPLLVIQGAEGGKTMAVRYRVASLTAGVSIPLVAAFCYLLWTGSLRPFLDFALNYWPLYTHMSGSHQPIGGLARLSYVLSSTRVGLDTFLLPMAVTGLCILRGIERQKRLSWLLFSLLAAGALYPAAAGQFWTYHWIPFSYIALCSASFTVSRLSPENRGSRNYAPLAVVFLLWLLSFYPGVWTNGNAGDTRLKAGVPDDVHNFLSSRIKPGDSVQPLDWTGGAVHGMLMSRAPLATRFMYDFHFYHHVGDPYIRALRREFINELGSKRPRFIIEVLQNKPSPAGPDTSGEFPELRSFLEKHYKAVRESSNYRIFERVPDY